jgi:hypothetical protein
MDRWTDGNSVKWIDELINKQLNGQMGDDKSVKLTDGLINSQLHGQMDSQLNGHRGS